MKLAVTILTLILAFLTVQPVFSSLNQQEETRCCIKNKKCPEQNKNNCDQTACNPLRVCVYGSPFVIENSTTDILIPTVPAQRIKAINDNRTSSRLSECWHPPRMA